MINQNFTSQKKEIMKKIYKASRLLFVFLIAANLSATAQLPGQGNCPAGAKITHTQIFTSSGVRTVVYIEGFVPNSNFSLFKSGEVTPFVSGQTDNNGSGHIDYTGLALASQVTDLSVCDNGSNCQVCFVPLINFCTLGQVQNIRYTSPVTCCVYVRATAVGETARIYDANGVEIGFSIDPNRQIGTLVCLVYDCSKTPTTISICGAGGCCSAPIPAQGSLPVRLTALSVRPAGSSQAKIEWSTDREEGSQLFVVEKSTNGADFTMIGELKAAGNTLNKNFYSYTDNVTGAAYYRLKMVDIDGKFVYSKVLYINNGKTTSGVKQILPNPTSNGSFQLIGISSADLNGNNVRVFNISGKQIGYSITGANAITLNGNVPPGIYVVKVKDQSLKLVKQ
jgi:hypothetical protein